jgi:ABC-type transport system involved in cytochrome c biogenesis permease subunit
MFETMMTLGACMGPFLLFTELGLKSRTGWIDAFLAAVILFPSCFIFDDRIKPLMPALRSNLFFPHVMTYLLAYASMAKAMILSVISLLRRASGAWTDFEKTAYRMTSVGFPLLTTGLLLGGVWAQRAWGDYWSWDPKEVWSLNTWIIYLIYFHVRLGGGRKMWWCDALNVLGFLAIVVTLLAVNLAGIFGGLHAYA